jgi:nitrile hydratase accessory protein
MAEPNPEITTMDGEVALPRSNGELVFEAPWEGRAFGIAVALNEQAVYPWRSFRDALVGHIASDEASARDTSYYERWLASLETLLLDQGIVTQEELEARHAEYESGERDDDWDPDHHVHHDHEDYAHS